MLESLHLQIVVHYQSVIFYMLNAFVMPGNNFKEFSSE